MEKDKIGALIIESDDDALKQLVQSLESNPLVSFIVNAEDTDAALLKVIDLNPDIVFLEYPVKGKTGAGIIKFIQSKLPAKAIVFVSKTTDYAAEAIRFEVYDYLLKPVTKSELGRILEKVQLRKQPNLQSRINEIIENKLEDSRLRINTTKGFAIINSDEILYCKSYGAYTELHLTNNSKELTYMSLSKIEEILVPFNFVRISRSILINKNYIRKLLRTNYTFILSSNGVEYELKGSKTQVKALSKTEFE
jgi:DNA-binding LytR/AlgR family response regulator